MTEPQSDEIAKLESLYAMNPDGRVFAHLAEAYRKSGQLEQARSILDEGLRKHPDYASAHVVLGRVLVDSGDEAAAAYEFRRVLELDRHNLVALRSLGDLAVAGGREEEALHYYDELAVLDPTDSTVQERLSELRVGIEPAGDREAEGGIVSESVAGAVPEVETESAEAGVLAGFEETALAGSGEGAGPDGGSMAEREEGELAELSRVEPEVAGSADVTEPESVEVGGIEEGEVVAIGAEEITGVDAGEITDFEVGDVAESEADEIEIETALSAEGPGPELEAALEAEPVVEPDAEIPEGPAVEGRWDEPGAQPTDLEAERSGGAVDAGVWVPAERWEWVSASAGPPGEPESGEEAEPDEVVEPEEIMAPDWLTGPAADAVDAEAVEGIEEAAPELSPEPVVRDTDAEALADAEAAAGEEPTFEPEIVEAAGEAQEPEAVAETDADEEWTLEAEAEAEEELEAAGEEDEGRQVITETLAEIYASQGLLDRAASVYRRLIELRPDDERLVARLAEIEAAPVPVETEPEVAPAEPGFDAGDDREAWLARVESAWTGGEGAEAVSDSPYTWPREVAGEEEGESRSIGDYLGSLLAWRPSGSSAPAGPAEPTPGSVPEDWLGEPAAGGEGETGASQEEEDLEMFRSWLKSLKK